MSEEGLVEGAADVFVGVKKSEDYHTEMNSQHYEEWIRYYFYIFRAVLAVYF